MTDHPWLWLFLTAACGLFLWLVGCGGESDPGWHTSSCRQVALTCQEYHDWTAGEMSKEEMVDLMAWRCADVERR